MEIREILLIANLLIAIFSLIVSIIIHNEANILKKSCYDEAACFGNTRSYHKDTVGEIREAMLDNEDIEVKAKMGGHMAAVDNLTFYRCLFDSQRMGGKDEQNGRT